MTCRPSIGIAETGTVGYDSAALLAAADLAMYEVKRTRKRVRDAAPAGRRQAPPEPSNEPAHSL